MSTIKFLFFWKSFLKLYDYYFILLVAAQLVVLWVRSLSFGSVVFWLCGLSDRGKKRWFPRFFSFILVSFLVSPINLLCGNSVSNQAIICATWPMFCITWNRISLFSTILVCSTPLASTKELSPDFGAFFFFVFRFNRSWYHSLVSPINTVGNYFSNDPYQE